MDMTISGPSSVTVGDSISFYCFPNCNPSCDITWHYRGEAFDGDTVSVPILQQGKRARANKLVLHVAHFHKTERLECSAVNVLSGKTGNYTVTLHVTGERPRVINVCFMCYYGNFSYFHSEDHKSNMGTLSVPTTFIVGCFFFHQVAN